MLSIDEFTQMLRDSFIGAEHVYMNGSCFYLAKILRAMYGGDLMENHSHVYLLLNGKYYDIRGEVAVSDLPSESLFLAKEPTLHGKFDMFIKHQ